MTFITFIRNHITEQINKEHNTNHTTEDLIFAGIDIEISTEYVGSYTGENVIIVEVSGYAASINDAESKYYVYLQYDRADIIPLVNEHLTYQIRINQW